MGLPDEKIYPHATGAAAQTVAQHQVVQELIFYAGWFCPFVNRVWIVLEEKGIPYQYIEVNPYKKEQHFLDINPKGLVPAVEYHGRALYESLILCEFLEDAYPDHAPRLLPADPLDRAYVRIWVDHVSKAIVPAYHRLLQAQGKDNQETMLHEYNAALKALADQVKGPYFLGEEFSMVDVAMAPWVVRDFVLREHRGYTRQAVGGGWKEYADKLENRESVKRTWSDQEHYTEIYGRYLRDESQSQAAQAVRNGRPMQ